MAVIKLVNDPYYNEDALDNMFHYLASQNDLLNDTSSPANFMGGCNFILYDINSIADQFKYVKRHFHKTDKSQLIHFIISFPSNELKSMNKARGFADFICSKFSCNYQILYAIHHKPNNLHIHFVLNTISFTDGSYFYQKNGLPGRLCYETNYYFGREIARYA